MPSLETVILTQIKEAPKVLLRRLLERKLKEAGLPQEHMLAAVNHFLEMREEVFYLPGDDEGDDKHVTITISPEDVENLTERAKELMDGVPDLVERAVAHTSKSMTKRAIQRWSEDAWMYEAELEGFRYNLDERWGVALSSLKLLLHLSRDFGAATLKRFRRSKAIGARNVRDVSSRLHTRACQVTAEIIALLENGYADGAMARWRTLHEICVVVLLIRLHGESIAKRYLDHEHVEAKSAMDEYRRNYASLGHEPLRDKEIAGVEENYAKVVNLYGSEFASPYGWAAFHLGRKKPIFSDLENAVDRRAMRSFYKMASYNVHASTKGISFRLASVDNPRLLISGACNAGLEEPGRSTAITLAAINSALPDPRWRLEQVVELRTMLDISDKAAAQFLQAARKLQKDERALQKANREKQLKSGR